MPKRVLITGANGFIGKNLCERLHSMGSDFMAMVTAPIGKPYRQFTANLDECDKIEMNLSAYKPDIIIHLAGVASPTFNNSSYIYEVNTIGTDRLLTSIKSLKLHPTVVIISTAGIYGNQPSELYREDLLPAPANHYSCSKYAMECLSRNFSDDIKIVILRPFNIIGAGQSETFIVPKLAKAFANREAIIHLGNTKPLRDFVDVAKLVDVMVKIIQTPPSVEVLNVCTGVGHSIDNVIDALSELTDFSPKIITEKAYLRSNEVWRLVGDPTRINEYMGDSLYIDLRELLGNILISNNMGEK
jgi:nucleoside-diphosphate-sugar epimerase